MKDDSEINLRSMREMYSNRYDIHGHSRKTLGWFKRKQEMRFMILTSEFQRLGAIPSITDIGCGFGDLNFYLAKQKIDYTYLGIDCVEQFITKASELHAKENIEFQIGNYLEENMPECDYSIGSGIFNYKFNAIDNYHYIDAVIEKAFKLSRVGVAFDFLSNKVDYQKYEHTFHSDPKTILDIGYKYTRNLSLRNDYAPFEFSLFLFKEDRFDEEDTVFNRFKRYNKIKTVPELS